MNNIFTTTLRLNLDREDDRKALHYLKSTDDFSSYSRAVVAAVNAYFDRREKLNADPYLETREKEYLCVRDGEERGFTVSEFKAAQADGWEKQYPYYVDKKKKEYLPPSEAETRGLEREDKHPKSTKFGRQNPITERWNSDEQLILWRSAWADTVNRALEQNGIEERIDHRSHAERGLDEQPTVHEGVEARAMERKGFASDRCELNRQIKADSALLRELKAAAAS